MQPPRISQINPRIPFASFPAKLTENGTGNGGLYGFVELEYGAGGWQERSGGRTGDHDGPTPAISPTGNEDLELNQQVVLHTRTANDGTRSYLIATDNAGVRTLEALDDTDVTGVADYSLLVFYDGYWIDLAPPSIGKHVLIFDGDAAAGQKVQWVEIAEFECPEGISEPEPTPDYVITGDADSALGSPNGDYFATGATHNGEPVYERDDGVFVMWKGTNWALSPGIDDTSPTLWIRTGTLSRDGDYATPAGAGRTSTGTPTVTLGT